MNELVMRTRWARAAQMIFIATALFGSAACTQISQADSVVFTGPDTEGTSLNGVRSELRCKPKEMMVAVSVHHGSWIESIELNCASRNVANGMLSPPYPPLKAKDQTQEDYSVACEDGQVVGALKARHDSTTPTFIRQLSLGCATVSEWESSPKSVDFKFDGLAEKNDSEHQPLACDPHQVAAGMSVWVDEEHVTNYSLYCILPP